MDGKGHLFLILSLLIHVVVLPAPLWSITSEQGRRIEEEKRKDLKPTIVTPSIPKIPKEEKTVEGPPVPAPIKEIYFVNLLSKRISYRYDAVKSIIMLMGVDEEYIDLDSQVRYLKEKCILPKQYAESFDSMLPLRKGLAAYLFLRALEIKGGIALHLFGPSERYALKELIFQGIMSPGYANDIVSGSELVQMMSQAARYKAERELRENP